MVAAGCKEEKEEEEEEEGEGGLVGMGLEEHLEARVPNGLMDGWRARGGRTTPGVCLGRQVPI